MVMNNRFCTKNTIHLLELLIVVLASRICAQPSVVSIQVDATQKGKPLKNVWQYYGYDECNYTTTPDCVALMKAVAQMNAKPVHLRQHFLLNSGAGTAALKWGSTNLYTENQRGEPVYSWNEIASNRWPYFGSTAGNHSCFHQVPEATRKSDGSAESIAPAHRSAAAP